MKNYKGFVYTISMLLGLLLLVGCSDVLNSQKPVGSAGETVTISINSTGRTLLPGVPEFEKYALTFTPNAGQTEPAVNPVELKQTNEYTLVLEQGSWTLNVIGMVLIENIPGIDDGYYEAASSGPVNFNVGTGASNSVEVIVRGGIREGVKGMFAWDISFTEEVIAGTLAILDLEEQEIDDIDLFDLMEEENRNGTIALYPGYYFLKVELENDDNNKAYKTEIIHIYSGLTTSVDSSNGYAFTTENFAPMVTLNGQIILNTADGLNPQGILYLYRDAGYIQEIAFVSFDESGIWSYRISTLYNDVYLKAVVTYIGYDPFEEIKGPVAVTSTDEEDWVIDAFFTPVTGISLNKSAASIAIGFTETLIAVITPSEATNQNVTWSSSDNDVATVSADGVVTAVSLGSAIITVTTEDGEYEDTCNITVLYPVAQNRFEYYWVDEHDSLVTTSGGKISVFPGETLTITSQGEGYNVWQWHLNSVNIDHSEDTYGFSSTEFGKYTVGLFVEKNGRLYNTNIIVIVSDIEMVWIPAGTYTQGSPADEPNRSINGNEDQRQVTLTSGFYMGMYQVTQEQYQAVMGNNPSVFYLNPAAGEVQERRPVERVSWYDAIVFCNRLSIAEGLTPAYSISDSTNPNSWGAVPYYDYGLHTVVGNTALWDAVEIVTGSTGYRLPTEAQWEYACRAGTTTAYNTGATISDNTGWYSANSNNITHEVGKKPANAWGLYDMHGNVFEWSWDWYDTYTSEAQTDPTGAVSGTRRILRGGPYGSEGVDMRSAYRYSLPPWSGESFTGFRLVRP